MSAHRERGLPPPAGTALQAATASVVWHTLRAMRRRIENGGDIQLVVAYFSVTCRREADRMASGEDRTRRPDAPMPPGRGEGALDLALEAALDDLDLAPSLTMIAARAQLTVPESEALRAMFGVSRQPAPVDRAAADRHRQARNRTIEKLARAAGCPPDDLRLITLYRTRVAPRQRRVDQLRHLLPGRTGGHHREVAVERRRARAAEDLALAWRWVADELGISVDDARRRLEKARAALRAFIDPP